MEFVLALLGVAAAWWQLWLQRKEIVRNGKINALVNISEMLRDRISFHSEIIDDLRTQKKHWRGHAETINDELRPLLDRVNKEIIEQAANYHFQFSSVQLKKALRLDDAEELK